MQQNGPTREGNFLKSRSRVLTLLWITYQTSFFFGIFTLHREEKMVSLEGEGFIKHRKNEVQEKPPVGLELKK